MSSNSDLSDAPDTPAQSPLSDRCSPQERACSPQTSPRETIRPSETLLHEQKGPSNAQSRKRKRSTKTTEYAKSLPGMKVPGSRVTRKVAKEMANTNLS
jgi:hypothetical protein